MARPQELDRHDFTATIWAGGLPTTDGIRQRL